MNLSCFFAKKFIFLSIVFTGGVFCFQNAFAFLVPPSLDILLTTNQKEAPNTSFSEENFWIAAKKFSKNDEAYKMVSKISQYEHTSSSGILSNIQISGGAFSGMLSFSGVQVNQEYFVTLSNGDVRKEKLMYLDTTGDTAILHFPVLRRGEYKIEVLDSYGFPFFQYDFFLGERFSRRGIDAANGIYTERDILKDINILRASLGRPPLQFDDLLQKIAGEKVQNMAKNSYVWHFTPEWYDILDLAKNIGISQFSTLWENVAGGNVNLSALQQGLLASGWHRYNMLDSNWKKIGIGFSYSGGMLYLSQVFAE